MSISTRELKALLQKSGNRCAIPNCGEILLHEGVDFDDHVILSTIAHIVAESPEGPRGNYKENIQNFTLSIPRDLLRRAKILAVQEDTSLSGLLAQALPGIFALSLLFRRGPVGFVRKSVEFLNYG